MTPAEFGNLFAPIFAKTFTNLADLPDTERPSHLAHYTSLSVLEKIVSNNELWFSNPLYMNDHEEMLFGIREGLRIMQDAGRGSALSDIVKGVDNFQRIRSHYTEFLRIFDVEVSHDVYVFCLSEYDFEGQPDGRLSMWRGYGADGNGVALVFKTDFIHAVYGSPLLIAKVRYGTGEERAEWIKESLADCLKVLGEYDINSQTIKTTAWNMFRLTLYHSLSSKHLAFKEEDEWRIVYFSDLDVNKLFKDRRGYLIRGNRIEPKLKFPIEPLGLDPKQVWTFDSILKRIVLGPTHASTSLSLSSTKRMLECLGKPEFADKIWMSRIPYRPIG